MADLKRQVLTLARVFITKELKRANVDLPERERDQLDALCRQRGLSRAEAIRQALRLWLRQQTPSHAAVFGLWRDRPEGALELQEALRQEWRGR